MTDYYRLGRSVCWLFCLVLLSAPGRAQALERWLYCPQNLAVDHNITNLVGLMERAAKAAYTHVLLSDSKFSHLGDMAPHYFQNIQRIKQAAEALHLEIVPTVFPIGYSNDLLYNDPNLVEALPVRNALLIVSNGVAHIQSEVLVAFPGGDFSNLSRWTWKDNTVIAENGTARITNPNGANARIVQHLKLQPFRQYHIAVRVKTQGFAAAADAKVLVLAGSQTLNFDNLGVQPTQDWTTHHVVFNTLTNADLNVYFGVWGGTSGSLWLDDAAIEEVAFLNLVRRPGAPLAVQAESGAWLIEGKDFASLSDPLMGSKPWPGSYDVFHSPPQLQCALPDGTRLRASWYHAATVNDDQAAICLSEPKTVELLRDQAGRMRAAWGTRGYFMSHDELRVMNWCAACQARQMQAGAMLADNIRVCTSILRAVNPGGRIYVWSDMFDPNHNAHANYYLVRGDLAGSWLGLDKDVIVVPWDYDQRAASLKFFAGLGNRQVIAGYYDASPSLVTNWLNAAQPYTGITGVIYTTWQNHYQDLEKFNQIINGYPLSAAWLKPRLEASVRDGLIEIELQGERGQHYGVEQSVDLAGWTTITNMTAADATVTVTLPAAERSGPSGLFLRGVCLTDPAARN